MDADEDTDEDADEDEDGEDEDEDEDLVAPGPEHGGGEPGGVLLPQEHQVHLLRALPHLPLHLGRRGGGGNVKEEAKMEGVKQTSRNVRALRACEFEQREI